MQGPACEWFTWVGSQVGASCWARWLTWSLALILNQHIMIILSLLFLLTWTWWVLTQLWLRADSLLSVSPCVCLHSGWSPRIDSCASLSWSVPLKLVVSRRSLCLKVLNHLIQSLMVSLSLLRPAFFTPSSMCKYIDQIKTSFFLLHTMILWLSLCVCHSVTDSRLSCSECTVSLVNLVKRNFCAMITSYNARLPKRRDVIMCRLPRRPLVVMRLRVSNNTEIACRNVLASRIAANVKLSCSVLYFQQQRLIS